MDPIKLHITPDGNVCGLWVDSIVWRALGRITVRRASHVEFDHAKQKWVVRAVQPAGRIRFVLQQVTRIPCGEALFSAETRECALRWERRYFGVGGLGWKGLP